MNSPHRPDYVIPPFDGIGATEYIFDVTHDLSGPDRKPLPAACFMARVDTNQLAKLNT